MSFGVFVSPLACFLLHQSPLPEDHLAVRLLPFSSFVALLDRSIFGGPELRGNSGDTILNSSELGMVSPELRRA
jgi:hypothetical protein